MLAGVVRKIQAGAKHILFERAEEARAAHFSTMRALGVDVPSSLWPPIPIAVANAGLGDDSPPGSVEPVVVKDKSLADQLRQGMDMSKHGHSQNPKNKSEGQGTTLSRSEGTNLMATDHTGNGCKGDVAVQGVENQMRGKLQDNALDRRGANIESVIQKYKKAAGSTLNLNCLFRGADLLKDDSPETDLNNRPETVERLNCGPVDVDKMNGGFDVFLDQWRPRDEFCFDLNLKNQSVVTIAEVVDIEGIAICWKDSPVYYVGFSKCGTSACAKESSRGSLPDGKIVTAGTNSHLGNAIPQAGNEPDGIETRWKKISSVLSRPGSRKVGWNLKSQLRALRHARVSQPRGKLDAVRNAAVPSKNQSDLHSLSPIVLGEPYADIRVAAWLLWPDEESSQNLSIELVISHISAPLRITITLF